MKFVIIDKFEFGNKCEFCDSFILTIVFEVRPPLGCVPGFGLGSAFAAPLGGEKLHHSPTESERERDEQQWKMESAPSEFHRVSSTMNFCG